MQYGPLTDSKGQSSVYRPSSSLASNSYTEPPYSSLWEAFLVLIMGACVAKLSRGKDKFCYKTHDRRRCVSGLGENAVEEQGKKCSLQELHQNPPPGFRKFEIEVPWQSMEEHVALQLWDVYRALYTF